MRTLQDVDLGALAVVLELAGEGLVSELVQHLGHARHRLGQHWLHRHARLEAHRVRQPLHMSRT